MNGSCRCFSHIMVDEDQRRDLIQTECWLADQPEPECGAS